VPCRLRRAQPAARAAPQRTRRRLPCRIPSSRPRGILPQHTIRARFMLSRAVAVRHTHSCRDQSGNGLDGTAGSRSRRRPGLPRH
jgi:hypothetical protein